MNTSLVQVKSKAVQASLVTLLYAGYVLSPVWLLYAFNYCYLPYPVAAMVAVLGWCVFGMLAVVFPLWIHDASQRVSHIRYLPMPVSEAHATLAFFLPFRQILMPYGVMRSLLFRATGTLTSMPLVRLWSLSWLALLCGAAMWLLSDLGILHSGYGIVTLVIYGAATVFCLFSAILVRRFERCIEKPIGEAMLLSENFSLLTATSAAFVQRD